MRTRRPRALGAAPLPPPPCIVPGTSPIGVIAGSLGNLLEWSIFCILLHRVCLSSSSWNLSSPLPSTPLPSSPLPGTLFCGGALCRTQGSLTRCFEKILCDESGSNTQQPLCRDAVVSEQQRLLAMPQLGVPAVDVPGTTCCELAIPLNKRWSEASPGCAEL